MELINEQLLWTCYCSINANPDVREAGDCWRYIVQAQFRVADEVNLIIKSYFTTWFFKKLYQNISIFLPFFKYVYILKELPIFETKHIQHSLLFLIKPWVLKFRGEIQCFLSVTGHHAASHSLAFRFSPFHRCYLARRRVTMETRTVMRREMEEQSTQMSHSMQLSSQIKKKTFKSRCTHTLELGEMIGK